MRRWFRNTGERKYVENWPYTADVTLQCWCGEKCLGLQHRIQHDVVHKAMAAGLMGQVFRGIKAEEKAAWWPDQITWGNITRNRSISMLRGITS